MSAVFTVKKQHEENFQSLRQEIFQTLRVKPSTRIISTVCKADNDSPSFREQSWLKLLKTNLIKTNIVFVTKN